MRQGAPSTEGAPCCIVIDMPWTRSDLDMRSLIADRTAQRLQQGDPTLGWSGDPYLVLTWNRIDEVWEVFRDVGGEVSLVARKAGELDGDRLIRELVRRDSQSRGFEDTVDAMIKHNDAVQADRERKAHEAQVAAAEHLAYAANKDGLV